MFLVNSRLGLLSATLFLRAPLIPKLRGNFAEFLNKSYLARLWILSSPTCVRLRYGHLALTLETFLGSLASPHILTLQRLIAYGFAYMPVFVLQLKSTNQLWLAFFVIPSDIQGGPGIST